MRIFTLSKHDDWTCQFAITDKVILTFSKNDRQWRYERSISQARRTWINLKRQGWTEDLAETALIVIASGAPEKMRRWLQVNASEYAECPEKELPLWIASAAAGQPFESSDWRQRVLRYIRYGNFNQAKIMRLARESIS